MGCVLLALLHKETEAKSIFTMLEFHLVGCFAIRSEVTVYLQLVRTSSRKRIDSE